MRDPDIELAREIHRTIFNNTESVEIDYIGADGFYLMAALLDGGVCAWAPERAIVRLLRAACPNDHRVWEYIDVADM